MGRGTIRRMVEGVRHQRGDPFYDPIDVAQHIRRRNAKHSVPAVRQERVSPLVARWTVTSIVSLAVDFNDQTCLAHIKIDDVRPDRMLPSDLHSDLAATQPLPDHYLRQAHLPSQLARGIDLRLAQRDAPSTIRSSANGPRPRSGEDQACHLLHSIQVAQAAFARSRTRPM